MADILKTLASICETREREDGTIQVEPTTHDQLSALVSSANQHRMSIDTIGAGTHLWLCRTDPSANIRLDMRKLSGVLQYEPADMTLTARAGTPLAEIEEILNDAGQELALDTHDDTATLGGVFASGWNGLRARGRGLNRDRMIGMQAMLPDSTLFQSGGKVVKNVSGYDLSRLLAGSHGTLGIFTEISVRVTLKPKLRRILIWPFYRLTPAARDMFLAARTVPATACGAMHASLLPGISDSPLCEADVLGYVLLEGNPPAVKELTGRLYHKLGQPMVSVERGPRMDALWRELLQAPVALLDKLGGMIEVPFPPAGYEAVLGLAHDEDQPGCISSDRGVLYTSHGLEYPQSIDELRESLAWLGAFLAVRGEAAPGIDKWGKPQGQAWLEKLKTTLDPNRILNPGHGIFGAE